MDSSGPEKASSEGVTDTLDDRDNRQLRGPLWAFLVLAILCSTFLYALDNTVIATTRPSIVDSFGHVDKLPWVSVAYAVGEVGSNPFWSVSEMILWYHVNTHLTLESKGISIRSIRSEASLPRGHVHF